MKGFTLIELLTVVALILLLTGVMLVLGRQGAKELALVRSAERLAFDLERTKALSLETRRFSGAIPCGYGIFFSLAENTYTIYADTPPGASLCASQGQGDIKRSDNGGEDVEAKALEPGVVFASLSPVEAGKLWVVFSPPRPALKLYPAGSRAEIRLQIAGGASQKTVVAEESGEIYVK